MSEFDQKLIVDFLREKWGGRACPMCNGGPWNIEGRVFQIPEFHKGDVILGGPVVPVVPVTCANCGNTQFVNALLAKLVSRESPPASAGAE